jgi:hypothetical protein
VCNKACYGWEGLKKMFCCCGPSTKRVREIIDHVAIFDQDTGNETLLFATDKAKTDS